MAPYVFDASVQQIFGALLQGHTLYLVPEEVRIDGTRLLEFYQKQKIDISDGTPAHLHLLLESMAENPSPLEVKHFIIGGEALAQQTVAKFLRQYSDHTPIITNVYGPTECCVDSTSFDVSADILNLQDTMTIPIGSPMPNVQVYIVDRKDNLQPMGIVGELCISGGGIGRGYLKREKLTSIKFSANLFQEGKYWYRTGDLARWRSDGNIEFLGRIDHQVKVRGFRIELGEIENTVINYGKHPNSIVRPVREANNDAIVRCTRCLLPATYPAIHFDEEGICNICRQYDKYEKPAQNYFKNMDDFHCLIANAKQSGGGKYNCMLLYSGGKDSSYVLYRLVDMGLKVLTFTFDNGYISPMAFENIKRMTSNLNVDNIIYKIENMPEIFRESLMFDHTVCTGCFKVLTTMSTQVAYEKDINVVITGLSRGQIFDTKLHALFEQDIFEVNEIEEKLLLFRKMYHVKNDGISKFLKVTLPDEVFDTLHFVDFFRYDDTPNQQDCGIFKASG